MGMKEEEWPPSQKVKKLELKKSIAKKMEHESCYDAQNHTRKRCILLDLEQLTQK